MSYDPHPTIEHGSTKGDRWLRSHTLPLALGIAVVEGVLVLVGDLQAWAVVGLAVVIVAVYFLGRDRLDGETREVARVIALSQMVVVAVPLLAGVIFTLAMVLLVVLGLGVLLMILRDRQR